METIIVKNIDVKLLKEQRDHLLELIKELDPESENNTGATLQGIVNMLDEMLDKSSDNPDKIVDELQVIMASQQLEGYNSASSGESIASLITSMGLKKEEWEALKSDGSTDHLRDFIKEYIDNFFSDEE